VIKSKYISDILELLLDGEEGVFAKRQLSFITEKEFDYTGTGLFVSFSYSENISKYKISEADLILNGVKVQSTEPPLEAEAILFFSDGLIDYLEIWCYLGNYPSRDLTKYTLEQIWKNSPNKIIATQEMTAEMNSGTINIAKYQEMPASN